LTAPDAGAGDVPGAPGRLLSPSFVLVTASTFAYFLGLGSLLPTLPRFVEDGLGGGSIAVGVSVGVFSLAAAALRPFAGRLGDLRGRRLLVVGGAGVFGLSVLAYAVVDQLAVLVALRLLTGIGEAAMWVGAATAIQDLAPPDRRGEAASYFSVALYAGLALGPALGEWALDRHGFDTVWYLAGGLSLVAALLGTATPRGTTHELQRFRLLHPTAIAPGLVLFVGLLPFVGFSAFMPLYGPEVDMADVAPLFLVYGGLVLVIRVVGARLPDRLGWRRASTFALAVLGAAGLLLGLWAAAAGVWLATVALALGMSLLFPALFSNMVASVPESERGQAVGTFSVFFDLASGVGPPLLGLLVGLGSYRLGFAAAGLVAVAGLALLPRLDRPAVHA
jgi:MFS family permease